MAAALGLLLLAGCTTTRGEPAQSAVTAGPRSVMVVPFDASSLPPEQRWLGEGVAQIASLGLIEHPGIVQVDRVRAAAAGHADAWTEAVVRRVVRELHADAALYGQIRRDAERFVIQPRLLDLRAGRAEPLPTIAVAEIELLLRLSDLPVRCALALQPLTTEAVSPRIAKAAYPTDSLRAFELFARGQTAFYRGDAEAAVDALLQAIETDRRQFPRAHYALGVVHFARGDKWKAAAQLRAAVQLDPSLPEPWKTFGDLFLAPPRPLPDLAIKSYTRATELRPFYADAYVGLGDARTASGDDDAALAAYQQALTLDPFNAVTHVKLGRIWAARGLCHRAETAYQSALGLDSTVPDVRCPK